jgi:hypothetical protein
MLFVASFGFVDSLRAAWSVPLEVAEPAGIARRLAPVTSGVPFPPGLLQTNGPVRLLDERDEAVPLQANCLATWRDGSVKWLLLDFQTDVATGATRRYRLEPGLSNPVSRPHRLQLQDRDGAVWVTTGPLQFSVCQTNSALLGSARVDRDGDGQFAPGEMVATRMRAALACTGAGAWTADLMPPEEVAVEESGPLRAVIRVRGWFRGGSRSVESPFMQYLCRIHAHAGSAAVRVQFTATRLGATNPVLMISRLGLGLDLAPGDSPDRKSPRYRLGGQNGVHGGRLEREADFAELVQPADSVFVI